MRRLISIAACVLLAAAAGICAAGCGYNGHTTLTVQINASSGIAFTTVTAKKGSIEETIKGDAQFCYADPKNVYYEGSDGTFGSFAVSEGYTVKKGDVLATLQPDNIKEQIKLQKLVIETAELKLEQAKNKNDEYSIKSAKNNLEQQENQLASLKKQLEETTIKSPIDGVVTYINSDIKEGDGVEAYETLVTVADPEKMYLVCNDGVDGIMHGMDASFTTYEGITFKGKVIMTPDDLPYDADDDQKNKVVFKIDGNAPDGTESGDGASFKIVVIKKENIIVISKDLLKTDGDDNYVMLLINGCRVKRDVEVGIETSSEVEISDGLEVGDKIIVS